MKKSLFVLCLCLCLQLKADEPDPSKVAEAFGHLIGKNLETLGVEFDIDSVIRGLQDAVAGKGAPMSEEDCIAAISEAQEAVHKQKAVENLAKAEAFLQENAKKKGVVAIEEDKLQYKIEKKGKGAKVEPGGKPVITYVGKFLDGSVFGQSEKEEEISLEETIPGFRKGIVGMKEGEKRTLYIHPEFGYGTQGFLPPNSLLTFEIEVVKTKAE